MQQKNKDVIFVILALVSIIVALVLIIGGVDFIYKTLLFNGNIYQVEAPAEAIAKKMSYGIEEYSAEEKIEYAHELMEFLIPILEYQEKVTHMFKESVIILTKILLIFTAGIFLAIALFFRKSKVSEWVGHMDQEDAAIRETIYKKRKELLEKNGGVKK